MWQGMFTQGEILEAGATHRHQNALPRLPQPTKCIDTHGDGAGCTQGQAGADVASHVPKPRVKGDGVV
jgi:hypothetical protein